MGSSTTVMTTDLSMVPLSFAFGVGVSQNLKYCVNKKSTPV